MRIFFKHFICLLFLQNIIAQVQEEVNPPDNIKSIVFKGPTENQFPVIKVGEPIYLEFDDILANEQDYYYKVVHCDYDWTPSSLLKSQYLDGVDNQRITDYENSYSTLQSYSNYQLTIPNDYVRLKVSGNYLLEVYNSYNEIQFSRRFVVYKDIVSVSTEIKRSRDFNYINEKQVVQFSITSGSLRLINPKKEVKVAILQNHYWPTVITDIAPQYTMGDKLVYKYDQETAFYGGNEFLLFDTSDLRAPSSQISSIDLTDLYNHYLFSDDFRNNKPYTYFPDINGDFVVRTLQGDNTSREAEYTNVHFSLPYTEFIALDDVYVFGKFNNYALTDENKMIYNEKNGMLEATLKMKQGFYNYKYTAKSGDQIKLNEIGGNFHFTENTYLVLVYYRNFGDMYDSIIGIGSANSRNITN